MLGGPMRAKRRFRCNHIFRWLARHSTFLFAALLLALAATFTWFVVSGFNPSSTTAPLGLAAVAAVFAAISSIGSLLEAVETQKMREAQERPNVIAYFDPAANGVIFFVVNNSGKALPEK